MVSGKKMKNNKFIKILLSKITSLPSICVSFEEFLFFLFFLYIYIKSSRNYFMFLPKNIKKFPDRQKRYKEHTVNFTFPT